MEPRRIVSLVPSLTELIWCLGAGDRLVGRTRFCTEPAGEIEVIPIIGGTKNPHVDRILEIAPDLVVANREENREEDVVALSESGLAVLVTDPNTVAEAVAMILELGHLLGAEERATSLVNEIRDAAVDPDPHPDVPVFVAVWKAPLMGLGGDAFGNDLLEVAGARNVLGHRPRYPAVTVEEIRALHPALVLLPDEPYPFAAADAEEWADVAPARMVDGKLLWWYGPRMPSAIRELRALLRSAAPGMP